MHENEAPVLTDVAGAINEIESRFTADARGRAATLTLPGSRISTGNRRVVEVFSRYAVLDEGSVEKRLTDAAYELDRKATAALLRGLVLRGRRRRRRRLEIALRLARVLLDRAPLAGAASAALVRHQIQTADRPGHGAREQSFRRRRSRIRRRSDAFAAHRSRVATGLRTRDRLPPASHKARALARLQRRRRPHRRNRSPTSSNRSNRSATRPSSISPNTTRITSSQTDYAYIIARNMCS